MRRLTAAGVVLAVMSSLALAAGGLDRARSAAPPPYKRSNPGQLNIVTVNAGQARVLDKKSFEMIFQLSRTLRFRPAAFDGGAERAAAVPDIILLQEMRFSNLEIFKRLIKQRYPYPYEVAGSENATTKILVNLETVTPTGDGATWDDVCLGGRSEGGRTYQWLRVTDNTTGAPLVVASVHFFNKYKRSGGRDCLLRNVEFMRTQLDILPGTVVVGGDFNKRAVSGANECDPNEKTEPLPWYERMVGPDITGRVYDDVARVVQRRRGASMARQWTFERPRPTLSCLGYETYKRSRIDYLFVRDAIVADGGADDPGWAGKAPGTRHPRNEEYSDHRFVFARLVLAPVKRGKQPSAVPAAGGTIHLSWPPVPQATGYVVLRAKGRRPYDPLVTVGAEERSFTDRRTGHGLAYRYSIAPRSGSAEGWESPAAWATADARGPAVVARSPRRAAEGVDVRTAIEVRFDERVKRSSVNRHTVRLLRRGNRVTGKVAQIAPRVLEFTPRRRLRNATTYRVVVGGMTDVLGNRGRDDSWAFTTEARRKKRR